MKPDNILVTSGTRKSVFGCQFKLADLGLCHFRRIRSQRKGKKAVSREVDPADDDKYGTRIYGKPKPKDLHMFSSNDPLRCPGMLST